MLSRIANDRRTLPVLLAILVLAGGGLRAYRAANPATSHTSQDERNYAGLAINLADNHRWGGSSSGVRRPFHWPPGAPVLFAVAVKVAPPSAAERRRQDIPSAYWALALIGTLVIPTAYLLGLLLAGPWAGIAGATFTAFYPPLVRTTGELLSEPLGALLLTAAMAFLVWAWRAPPGRRHVLAGVLFGLAILTRADLLFVPFLLAVLLFVAVWRRGRREQEAAAAAAPEPVAAEPEASAASPNPPTVPDGENTAPREEAPPAAATGPGSTASPRAEPDVPAAPSAPASPSAPAPRRSRRSPLVAGLLAGGLLAAAAAVTLAPWTIYASKTKHAFVPVTEGDASALFVGTFLPGDGTTTGMKRELGAETKRRFKRLRGIRNSQLPAVRVLDAVAARHPGLSRDAALRKEARHNIHKYLLGDPVSFTGMMLSKLRRMWFRSSRAGSPIASTWTRTIHTILVLLSAIAIAAALILRRDGRIAAIALVVIYSTALHGLVVAKPRYNLPLMPMLVTGGAAAALIAWKAWQERRGADPPAAVA